MKRDIKKLRTTEFDVLVIGGGIHGAATAREASRQGFKTALIEMNDFGHSTSFNSMKVIHGGLRYLQHGNLKRIRQSVRSRKIMQKVAPNLIKAVPFLIPTYGHGIKSKNVMRLALLINDLISLDRNFNIEKKYHIPGGRLLSKNDILKIFPDIDKKNLSGGAVWFETVVQNTERLLLEFLLDAYNYDFTSANYVEATEILIQDNQVNGVHAKNLINSEEFDIYAKVIVNAVGPWFNLIQKSLNINEKPEIKLTKAVNIIVKKRFFSPYGVGLEGKQSFIDTEALIKRGKRLFFFVPIENYTMIGTLNKLYNRDINEFKINREDIQELIDEANNINPSLQLTFDDVSFYHAGLLPLDESSVSKNVQPERHSAVYDYEKYYNLKNLFSVKSVKYTTAPVIAENVVKRIKKKIMPSGSDCTETKFAVSDNEKGMPEEILVRLNNIYGSNSSKILKIVNENESLLNLVCNNPPVTTAEIIYVINNEMALTLNDVILRRTGLGMLECPSFDCITGVADVMASELGWDETKKAYEIENIYKVYSPLKTSDTHAGINR